MGPAPHENQMDAAMTLYILTAYNTATGEHSAQSFTSRARAEAELAEKIAGTSGRWRFAIVEATPDVAGTR